MPFIHLSDADRASLHALAHRSIDYGQAHHKPAPVEISDYPPHLREQRATFVTLTKNGDLRGCIGALIAQDPLLIDVAKHAYAAAFEDPRFAPVHAAELPMIRLEISILTQPEPFEVRSEQDLIDRVAPGVDGLVLESGWRKGTFLPSVWAQIPDPASFIRHLKLKAGLPADGWPSDLRVSRYQAQKI